jgi:predicted MPP superfamily phosphohydrolase
VRSTTRAAALAIVGLGAYSFIESHLYRLTTKRVPIGEACPPLSVLHISDVHMQHHNRRLATWLRALPARLGSPPDLVLATGDMIEGNGGIDPLIEALAPMAARLGCFYVLGSHDYYAPAFKVFTRYFGRSHGPAQASRADTARLEEGLRTLGWTSLVNTTYTVATPSGPVRLTGVDDPYLRRHRTEHIKRTDGEIAAIGLMHSPDVISEWFTRGYDLVVAGHTHAGQVRIPGVGALVTNCSLPNALAGGLHRVEKGWLHVSPGLGTGKYAPIRFACRPEATLLRLEPRDGSDPPL